MSHPGMSTNPPSVPAALMMSLQAFSTSWTVPFSMIFTGSTFPPKHILPCSASLALAMSVLWSRLMQLAPVCGNRSSRSVVLPQMWTSVWTLFDFGPVGELFEVRHGEFLELFLGDEVARRGGVRETDDLKGLVRDDGLVEMDQDIGGEINDLFDEGRFLERGLHHRFLAHKPRAEGEGAPGRHGHDVIVADLRLGLAQGFNDGRDHLVRVEVAQH